MRSRMLNLLVDELVKKIGADAATSGASTMPVLSVDDTSNTVTLGLSNGDKLPGVAAQSGYIPEPGHQATIIRNGMDLIVLPPQGPMTSTAPAATTGLVVTPGINMLVCTWDQAPEPDVANNRGFYQVQWASDAGMSQNVQTHVVAANAAVLSPLTAETWVQVRAIDQAGYPGPYCTPVAGTPATVPAPDGAAVTQALIDQATATSATLATDALTFLIVNSDGTVSKAAASFGKVTADEIEATAIGAVAVGAYALTAVNLAANAVTAANADVEDLVANIIDTNLLSGKLILSPTIETAASGARAVMSASETVNGFTTPAALAFYTGDGTETGAGGIYAQAATLSGGARSLQTIIAAPGSTGGNGAFIAVTAASSGTTASTSIYGDLGVDGNIYANGLPVATGTIPQLYTVQVSFTADGTNRVFSVSYSCPFSPTKAVGVSNTAGANVDSVTSIGSSGCSIEVAGDLGGVLASGSLVYVTLMLS